MEVVTLTLDEVEALRLADLEGLYQEEAAEKMKISRATFARIVEAARRKTAEALIHGQAIRLEGGSVIMKGETNMPNRDGTGPMGKGMGGRRGPCECGQRRGWGGGGRGPGWGCGRRGPRSDSAPETRKEEPPKGTNSEEKENES